MIDCSLSDMLIFESSLIFESISWEFWSIVFYEEHEERSRTVEDGDELGLIGEFDLKIYV